MADQRITQLNALPKAGVAATDVLPIADISASETKKVTAKDLVAAGIDLVDNGEIDLAKLDQNSATKLGTTALADNAVTYAKLQNVSATDRLLGRSSAGAGNVEEIPLTAAGRALLDDADAATQRNTLGLGTFATQNANNVAITGGTITGGTITGITDLAVADGGTGASDAATARSNLGVAIGTNVQAYDAGLNSIAGLTTAADQTIYTTSADTYAVTGLTAAGRALIDDADAAAQRTTLGLGSVATANQVSTAQIQDDAVTAAKLAHESTVDFVTTLPASGDYLGQLARVTGDNKLYCWDGSSWASIKAAGSINTIIGGTAGVVNVTATASGDTVTINTTLDNTSVAGQFLAGPSSAGGSVTYRTIAGPDLPTPTTSAKGGVVVNGNGLRMVGDTIALNNAVTPETSAYHLVRYDATGLVTAGRTIVGSDVPIATSNSIGVVKPGSGLGVDGSGTINHNNSIATGSATKVTFDSQGHITGALALASTDIPELDASKITSGTFPSARLASNSVTAAQLADYGIAQVSSTQPTPEFAGQLWINPTDRTAYVWVGQVSPAQGYYLPLNNEFGAQANLRFGGTYNASTNRVASLNTYGAASGLTVGSALVAPTAASSGLYLLVTTAGTGSSPAPAVALDVGDWLLSPGSGTTWTSVDIVGPGVSVVNASSVTFNGASLTPAMTGVADANAALTTLWGRSQIATTSTLGIVLETTEIEVNNSTGAMTIGVVDEGTY